MEVNRGEGRKRDSNVEGEEAEAHAPPILSPGSASADNIGL